MTIVDKQIARRVALEQVRLAMGELFGAERRLRGREQQESTEITTSQLRALIVLDHADEVTAGELAKSADLNPASVTAMLDQLESRGVIERKRGLKDRRVCLVSLTATGRAIVDERRGIWQALWEQRFGYFSEEELTAALRVMRTMIQVVDEI
jgi:MarR family transcriptional regulator, organic hydroperoxide resistance regulator